MKRRVVVTGIGAVTSLGCKVDELWTRICNGESGVRPLERLEVANYRVRFGGEIRNWSVDGYIEAKDVKRFDRFVQFAHVAGVNAVRDSGIDFSKENPWRCGVILGSGIGGLETIEVQHQRLLGQGARQGLGLSPSPSSSATRPAPISPSSTGCAGRTRWSSPPAPAPPTPSATPTS